MAPIPSGKELVHAKMPKIKQWISEYPDGVYSINAKKEIYCQPCQKMVTSDKKQHLQQHHSSGKHAANQERFLKSKKNAAIYGCYGCSRPFCH